MDWNNIDLNSYEVDCNLIDGLTFETLLLEIHCNIREINETTVRKQFEDDLNSRVDEAKSIFEANLKNIVKKAKKERAIK